MIGFRQRLALAVARSDRYRDDVWSLATDAGLGRKTIYNILHDTRLDESKAGPGFFGLSRVAALLDVSLDRLAGIEPKSKKIDAQNQKLLEHLLLSVARNTEGELSSDSLLRLHHKSGGRIEAFEDLIDRCDQYQIPGPDDKSPSVIAVGKNSLSAITMGSSSAELLESSLRDMKDADLLSRTMKDYRYAAERGSLCSVESRNIPMPSKPIRVKMDFIRVILSVSDADGECSLLLFALLAN